ncbi:ASCH domain-containing protein [Aquicoccus porphyridii]|uniref:ASCH domain-containing protein n=1 Tax=Aquicoccus porphyridii TaxID=1852029 RepID=A0A5A9ZCA0_9RHOB|nr:ASCH domain-containing protein [Aquicoccus porphyridii]KAA0914736.1 ASCH domain-containing protein [Aquicoccus porphyridii]RAI53352.1 ASCH domain-containing protein [Rhodobacteraceae bacterium AsT-22]
MNLDAALACYPGAQRFRFGDGPVLNSEILALVLAGRKSVTCDAVAGFEARGETPPEPGRVDIACDWEWRPVCAVRTIEVMRMPFEAVSEALVAAQGEFADLEDWRKGYEAYLGRTVGFVSGMEMLLERFEVVEAFRCD